MNSILQCLLATPFLNEYMITTFSDERHLRSTPLAQSFADLLSKVRGANGVAVEPSMLKRQLERTVSQFTGYG